MRATSLQPLPLPVALADDAMLERVAPQPQHRTLSSMVAGAAVESASNERETRFMAELQQLRGKCAAASHVLHENELHIKRLEDIVAGVIAPEPLVADAETCTNSDFDATAAGAGPLPYLHLAQLQFQLERESSLAEQERMEYMETITRLTDDVTKLQILFFDVLKVRSK